MLLGMGAAQRTRHQASPDSSHSSATNSLFHYTLYEQTPCFQPHAMYAPVLPSTQKCSLCWRHADCVPM